MYQGFKTVFEYGLSHFAQPSINKNVTISVAQRKLTRNILLAMKVDTDNEIMKYRYGNLSIYVDDDTIVRVEQGDNIPGFRVNKGDYERLNNLLYL